MSEPLRLPNADEALIPAEKLRDHSLDPSHPVGRHKARVFATALGIRRDDWGYLHDAILEALPTAPVTAVRERGTDSSSRYPFASTGSTADPWRC